jgi:hypothetical protein
VKKKKVVSRKIFSVIKFTWNFISLFITLGIGHLYNLYSIHSLIYWIFLFIATALIIAGHTLINKFIVVKE